MDIYTQTGLFMMFWIDLLIPKFNIYNNMWFYNGTAHLRFESPAGIRSNAPAVLKYSTSTSAPVAAAPKLFLIVLGKQRLLCKVEACRRSSAGDGRIGRGHRRQESQITLDMQRVVLVVSSNQTLLPTSLLSHWT
jgi:hypothetical protein